MGTFCTLALSIGAMALGLTACIRPRSGGQTKQEAPSVRSKLVDYEPLQYVHNNFVTRRQRLLVSKPWRARPELRPGSNAPLYENEPWRRDRDARDTREPSWYRERAYNIFLPWKNRLLPGKLFVAAEHDSTYVGNAVMPTRTAFAFYLPEPPVGTAWHGVLRLEDLRIEDLERLNERDRSRIWPRLPLAQPVEIPLNDEPGSRDAEGFFFTTIDEVYNVPFAANVRYVPDYSHFKVRLTDRSQTVAAAARTVPPDGRELITGPDVAAALTTYFQREGASSCVTGREALLQISTVNACVTSLSRQSQAHQNQTHQSQGDQARYAVDYARNSVVSILPFGERFPSRDSLTQHVERLLIRTRGTILNTLRSQAPSQTTRLLSRPIECATYFEGDATLLVPVSANYLRTSSSAPAFRETSVHIANWPGGGPEEPFELELQTVYRPTRTRRAPHSRETFFLRASAAGAEAQWSESQRALGYKAETRSLSSCNITTRRWWLFSRNLATKHSALWADTSDMYEYIGGTLEEDSVLPGCTLTHLIIDALAHEQTTHGSAAPE